MNAALQRLREERSIKVPAGLYSVCSSHHHVIEAVVRRASRTGETVLVEATANQVNQHGGYTGLAPEAFAAVVQGLCARYRVEPSQVVLGGDHLGPYPWRAMGAAQAMQEAEVLVRQFVRAGAQKIHLDASMPLGGDPGPTGASERAGERAVSLCAAAEDEWRALCGGRPLTPPPWYVIGTEVPVPGGEAASETAHAPVPTRADDFHETVELHRRLFRHAGLDAAWERVLAVVIQPGVEFDSRTVFPYKREGAAALTHALGAYPGLCFECHSTDYQSSDALRAMVEDGFAILKVGPELTFTMREGLFGLAHIEEELIGDDAHASQLRKWVLEAMRSDPRHWSGYYPDDSSLTFCLTYGYSDRMRYYWNTPSVTAAVRRLFENLAQAEVPPQLVSQFMPHAMPLADFSSPTRTPLDLLLACIDTTLRRYSGACTPVGIPAGTSAP